MDNNEAPEEKAKKKADWWKRGDVILGAAVCFFAIIAVLIFVIQSNSSSPPKPPPPSPPSPPPPTPPPPTPGAWSQVQYGKPSTLTCASGAIHVRSARYAAQPGCAGLDVSGQASKLFNGKQSYTSPVTYEPLLNAGDPCPNMIKTFSGEYSCA